MLVIRQEQMAALSAAMRESFKYRLADWLRTHFPDLCGEIAKPELMARVTNGLSRCHAYGFETERQIGEYFRLSFSYGTGFDENPQFGEILQSPVLDPEAKINLVGDIFSSLQERTQ